MFWPKYERKSKKQGGGTRVTYPLMPGSVTLEKSPRPFIDPALSVDRLEVLSVWAA